VLALKVEKEDFEKAVSEKASKIELENLMDNIKIVND
jgi:hypothetical protein